MPTLPKAPPNDDKGAVIPPYCTDSFAYSPSNCWINVLCLATAADESTTLPEYFAVALLAFSIVPGASPNVLSNSAALPFVSFNAVVKWSFLYVPYPTY